MAIKLILSRTKCVPARQMYVALYIRKSKKKTFRSSREPSVSTSTFLDTEITAADHVGQVKEVVYIGGHSKNGESIGGRVSKCQLSRNKMRVESGSSLPLDHLNQICYSLLDHFLPLRDSALRTWFGREAEL